MTLVSRTLALNAAWLALFVLAALPTLGFLWHHWTASVWHNGHGAFVPFIVGYLVWRTLREAGHEDEEGSAWGLAVVALGLLLMLADSAIQTDLLSAVGLIVCLPGFALLLLGAHRTRALVVPWLITFLMLPIPKAFLSQIHLFLRRISTVGTSWVLDVMGIPHVAVGTRIDLVRGAVEVADACSGFSATYAAVTVALVLAYLTHSNRRRFLLLAAAVPLAIFFNIVRVTGMVLIAHFHGFDLFDTWFHPFFGWMTFMGALVVLFALAGRPEEPQAETEPRQAPQAQAEPQPGA